MVLTAANIATRGIGFAMRLLFARCMPTEALGVMEMAGSVTMLAMTPVVAGIPTAISRLSAQSSTESERQLVLRTGLSMVKRLSWLIMPLLLLVSPAAAWVLGDTRTLPAIWAAVPSILLCGLCGVYGGYCFGTDRAQLPARFECVEQCLRFALAALLLMLTRINDLAVTAALPVLAESVAALLVLCFFRHALPPDNGISVRCEKSLRFTIRDLAWPMILARFCATGTRMLNAVLLPVCLRRSGLSSSAAAAQYGLLTGMAMPLIMLPGVVTGALCTVSTPVISRLDGQKALRRMVRRLSLIASGIGFAAAALLFCFSSFIGNTVYHHPALIPLIRLLSPAALLASIRQVQFGIVAGLGLQRHALTGTLVSSAVSLILTAWLVPLPQLRLYGAALAVSVGQLTAVCWNGLILRHAQKKAVHPL